MRRLFVPGYYCGFSNNKMSLDIAVVLAHLTGRVLVPYRFRSPRRSPVDVASDRVLEPLLVPDLFDIPVPWSDQYIFKTWISVPTALNFNWEPVFNSVLRFPATVPADDPQFLQFRNGRPHVYAFSEEQDEARDLHIDTFALGHYSYFFYLDDERRRQVIDLMKQLRPKRPYLEAAASIAASLGSFNAIHIRRGDFVTNDLAKQRISRAASISGQEIVANLATRMNRDDPLVVCTDGSSREEIFGPIQNYFRETIFLDRYLHESPHMCELLVQLPRNDESVHALLTQLVASKAQVFAGTMFSTFTALIHRMRGLAGYDSNFLYCYNDFLSSLVRFERCEFLPVDEGPYSWNRIRYPVSPDAYSWLREWPESFEAGSAISCRGVPPAGIIDLSASEATTHGRGIARFKDAGAQTVIGDWTESSAFATWELFSAESGTYSVELRYACPEESAGSCYTVEIEGVDALQGRVWNTGSWLAQSPWLPIGRMRVPAGRSTLAVRAIDKARDAVMNLGGVRLVPVEPAR